MAKGNSMKETTANPSGLGTRVKVRVAVRDGVAEMTTSVGFAGTVGLGEAVQVAIRVRVAWAVGVNDAVAVGVIDGLSVAVGSGVLDTVAVNLLFGVWVAVPVRVNVSAGTFVMLGILGTLVKTIRTGVGVSVSAFTAPAVAVRCMACSVKSILAHLVAMPAMAVLLMTACLVCVAGAARVSVAFLTAIAVAVARPETAVRVLKSRAMVGVLVAVPVPMVVAVGVLVIVGIGLLVIVAVGITFANGIPVA
jgi:hypothetical protein